MAPALGVLLCVVLAACAGRSSPRSTFNDGPPFGGPETEIVYSYSVKLIPPAGMADWESRKVASLPSIHLAELGASGTLSPEQRSMLAGKAGPSYIELPAIEKTGYVARRVDAGRYAFVKAVDVAQTGGQGLVCFDQAGRPLDASAVIDVRPGATVYAGHVSMEIALAPSADPKVLEASFARLTTAPAAPGEDFGKLGVTEGSVTRQPSALTACQPWVFRELMGRRTQCTGETRGQIDDRVKVIRGNRSIMRDLSKRFKSAFPVGPEQILPCPS
ncbi:hypothetical protein [Thalassobaculum fulvum]|nr:hypothetical protein [Thalassobaculum fulvum]